MLDAITQLARDAVTTAGYPGVLAAMVAENLFPPIPSEIVLPLAGYEASRGELLFVLVVLAATLGSLAGALLLYGGGRYAGRPAVLRWGRVLRVTARDLDRAERWFERWGDWVVLGARLVPLARSVVSVPAGTMRMSLPRFCALTALGSLLWNLLLVGAGFLLGSHWHDVSAVVARASDAIVVVAAVALVGGLAWLGRRQARARSRR